MRQEERSKLAARRSPAVCPPDAERTARAPCTGAGARPARRSLASLALPAYLQQQRQARRSDALVALQQLQMDQARCRDAHETYADPPSALGMRTELPPGGHYSIRLTPRSDYGQTLAALAPFSPQH